MGGAKLSFLGCGDSLRGTTVGARSAIPDAHNHSASMQMPTNVSTTFVGDAVFALTKATEEALGPGPSVRVGFKMFGRSPEFVLDTETRVVEQYKPLH